MEYPSDWETEVTKGWIVVYPPNEKDLDKDVSGFWVIWDNTNKHTTDDYLKERINRISSDYENFKLLESNNNVTLSGMPAYKLVLRLSIS